MSIRQAPAVDSDLQLYTRAARTSSARVIREYSTSFGMASRLFGSGCRSDIESIYGLVRIADEIVDGAAAEAGLSVDEQAALLDALEDETEQALATGYSANVVVHAFATVARATGIDRDLTAPFFASMRRDLSPVAFGREELRTYIYGSAEVVGLMCLRVFLRGETLTEADRARARGGRPSTRRGVPEDQLPARPRHRLAGARPQLLPGHRSRRSHREREARAAGRHRRGPGCRRIRDPAPAAELPPGGHRGALRVPRARRRALAHARRRAHPSPGAGVEPAQGRDHRCGVSSAAARPADDGRSAPS